MRRQVLALGVTGLLLASCATTPPPFEAAGWRRVDLTAGGRRVVAAIPIASPMGDVLSVVIEGDGRSHDVDGAATADPTPARAVGFDIAKAWPRGPVVWLGRLCQYVRAVDPRCDAADWTTSRFSDEAVSTAGAAIDHLKASADASRIVLVGWSGGGVLATLLASRRADVVGLITIAAPLDLDAWARLHRISPLTGSLDPGREPLPTLPQAHVFGAKDDVVPPAFGVRAVRGQARVEILAQAHDCCWAEEVPRIAALLDVGP